MSDNQPGPAGAAALAQKIVNILSGVDPETRRRAASAAMTLLGDAPLSTGTARLDNKLGTTDAPDLAAFFEKHEVPRPSENAYLCAAFHYARYGQVAFSLEDLRRIASDAGVVIPDR